MALNDHFITISVVSYYISGFSVFEHLSGLTPAIVYIPGARRQCCPRTQDQDLTAAVYQLRWRDRSTHRKLRRCAYMNPSNR